MLVKQETRQILILGLGNILLQDEGLGVRAVERLTSQYALPENVQIMDGGTLGLDLLPYLAGVTDLLILDAVDAGQPAGVLARLEGEAIPAALSLKMSMHQVGLQDLLAASSLRGSLPERIVVWGIQPVSLDWGVELTPSVQTALGQLVAAAVNELREWGIPLATIA
jgi:hydrogenase maturation protease